MPVARHEIVDRIAHERGTIAAEPREHGPHAAEVVQHAEHRGGPDEHAFRLTVDAGSSQITESTRVELRMALAHLDARLLCRLANRSVSTSLFALQHELHALARRIRMSRRTADSADCSLISRKLARRAARRSDRPNAAFRVCVFRDARRPSCTSARALWPSAKIVVSATPVGPLRWIDPDGTAVRHRFHRAADAVEILLASRRRRTRRRTPSRCRPRETFVVRSAICAMSVSSSMPMSHTFALRV